MTAVGQAAQSCGRQCVGQTKLRAQRGGPKQQRDCALTGGTRPRVAAKGLATNASSKQQRAAASCGQGAIGLDIFNALLCFKKKAACIANKIAQGMGISQKHHHSNKCHCLCSI